MLTVFATLMAVAGLILAALAAHVAWRRGTHVGWSLAVMLVAVAWWGLAYSFELTADEVAVKSRWGDLKYLGVVTLAPAWLVFVLQYTGRGRLVTPRVLTGLAVAPVVTLVLLAIPFTHDWVRYYNEDSVDSAGLPVVETGPAFWAAFAYNNVLLVASTGLFVTSMVRLARTYRRTALLLLGAALLPWAANLLHNFQVGFFDHVDLTPFAFTVTGGLLVWGLFDGKLVDLGPLARSAVVENMSDAVFVLDPFNRVVDVNPAGVALASASREALIGRRLPELIEGAPGVEVGPAGLTLPDDSDGPDAPAGSGRRSFDVSRQPLIDSSGLPAGSLVVLREVTQRVRDQERLEHVLKDRSRVAAVLQASMVPPRLPVVPGTEMASRYEPAGDGGEIGGDFLDVFPLDEHTWGFVLGDVSGKGAEAAAVSAAARYTLRALAREDLGPSDTLRQVNTRLLAQTDIERHCTLVHGHLRPPAGPGAGLDVTLSLAGHHPPLVLRASGEVEEVGRLGTTLALFDQPELHDTSTRLAPGELICAFTDGLVEARQGDELFDSHRVAELLRRHRDLGTDDLAGVILAAVREFHGPDLSDDLAILLVRNVGGESGAE